MTMDLTNRTKDLLVALWTALLVALLGAMTEVAMAQSTIALTLSQAVDLALKQNLDIQIANIEAAVKMQDRLIARSTLLPQASLDANEAITRYNTKAQLGVHPAIIPYAVGPYQAIHVGPTFSASVFDLALIRRYQASGHLLLAGRADARTVREQTVLLAVSVYMAHLRALASITAARSRIALAERLTRQAQDLLTSGVASKIDVSRAQVRLRQEQQRLVDDQRDAETTLFALKRILNVPDGHQVEFTDQQDFFTTPSIDFPDTPAIALDQRPELNALSESLKAAELAHKAAFAGSLPKLSLEGKWNEQGQTFNAMTPGYDYRLNVRFPIFTGGMLKAERKSTALAEQRARKQLDDERNRVTEQVRDDLAEVTAALHQVDLGRQEVQLANEEVSLSQGRFQSGVTENIEVTAAQDSLTRANDSEIDALFRYNIARAQLARATGHIEQTYTH